MELNPLFPTFFFFVATIMISSVRPSWQCASTAPTLTPVVASGVNSIFGPPFAAHLPDTPCREPERTAGVILAEVKEREIVYQDEPRGSCPCIGYRKFFYPSRPADDVRRTAGSLEVVCEDPRKFCICTVSGECFVIAGTITQLNFYAHCEIGGLGLERCYMYASFGCDNVNDALISTTSSRKLTCQRLFGPEGKALPPLLGLGSPFLLTTVVSCDGCKDITHRSCEGPVEAEEHSIQEERTEEFERHKIEETRKKAKEVERRRKIEEEVNSAEERLGEEEREAGEEKTRREEEEKEEEEEAEEGEAEEENEEE